MLREITQASAGLTPDETAVVFEDNLHPDLHVFDPESFVAGPPDNLRTESSIDEAFPELDVENEVSTKQEPDLAPILSSPACIASYSTGELGFSASHTEYDGLTDENDEFAEQIDLLWDSKPNYEVGEEIDFARIHDDSFDFIDFGELPRLDQQENESETENAHWEDLLELDLYDEDPDPSLPSVEDETITDGYLLDDYAARLVSQMGIIKLDERSQLQRRFRAIIDEFPFSSSYRALSRLVSTGNSLEELEDACELKCLWRDSPWLWSHRKFNRRLRTWETEYRPSYRSALTWKLALKLINRVGRVEAERRIFDDWRNEWLQMRPEHSSDGVRIEDFRFWSYPAFLSSDHDSITLADSDSWYYEEPVDIQPSDSFRLEDSEGEIWRFEPKGERYDTGLLPTIQISSW